MMFVIMSAKCYTSLKSDLLVKRLTTQVKLFTGATSCIPLKRHGLFVAFYCKIMLYGINYSIKTVKIYFHVPFRGRK